MTRWYWEQRGGTLVEEFRAVRSGPTRGRRLLDGLIILGTSKRLVVPSSGDFDPDQIRDKDIVVVQTKNSRLGMYLMGQTVFSLELMRSFQPRKIESVALCKADDDVLRPLLESHAGCRVVVCPPEVCRLTSTSSRRGRLRG